MLMNEEEMHKRIEENSEMVEIKPNEETPKPKFFKFKQFKKQIQEYINNIRKY